MTLAYVRSVGAPATAIALEELAASGVRQIVSIDVAGSIDPIVGSGDVVLVESAVACDGTSPHYSTTRVNASDEELTGRIADSLRAAGVPHLTGRTWSTDAVYRETPSQIETARQEGATLVDMETACLFAVSSALGIRSAAVLVAADQLYEVWHPPPDMSLIQKRLRAVLDATVACLLP